MTAITLSWYEKNQKTHPAEHASRRPSSLRTNFFRDNSMLLAWEKCLFALVSTHACKMSTSSPVYSSLCSVAPITRHCRYYHLCQPKPLLLQRFVMLLQQQLLSPLYSNLWGNSKVIHTKFPFLGTPSRCPNHVPDKCLSLSILR